MLAEFGDGPAMLRAGGEPAVREKSGQVGGGGKLSEQVAMVHTRFHAVVLATGDQ